jgi:hypothetical protein
MTAASSGTDAAALHGTRNGGGWRSATGTGGSLNAGGKCRSGPEEWGEGRRRAYGRRARHRCVAAAIVVGDGPLVDAARLAYAGPSNHPDEMRRRRGQHEMAATGVWPETQALAIRRGDDVEEPVVVDVGERDRVQWLGRSQHVRMRVTDKCNGDKTAGPFTRQRDGPNQSLGLVVIPRFSRRRGDGEQHAHETDQQSANLHTSR